jgi:DNA-nicking Smr family endonuclease
LRRRRHRELSRDELALWQRANVGTQPLGRGRLPEIAPPLEIEDDARPAAPASARAREAPPTPVRRHPPLVSERPVGIDRRTFERLKRGQMTIEGSLDLHGRTQSEAHPALERFLAHAQQNGRRCVLIVTGKGAADGGILRHMVPRWLNEAAIRQHVLTYVQARPQHGGAGAFYVLVRRRRHT